MRDDCTSADSPPLWRGRSAPVPESLLNSSGNLNLLADSPAQVGGRSAAITQIVPREGVFSGWAYDLCGGRSAPGARMVRLLFDNLYQRHCCLWWISRMNCGQSAPRERTVRRPFSNCTRDDVRLWWCGTHNCGRSAHVARTVRRGCNG